MLLFPFLITKASPKLTFPAKRRRRFKFKPLDFESIACIRCCLSTHLGTSLPSPLESRQFQLTPLVTRIAASQSVSARRQANPHHHPSTPISASPPTAFTRHRSTPCSAARSRVPTSLSLWLSARHAPYQRRAPHGSLVH